MSKGEIVLSLPRKASRGQMLGAWQGVWATFYVLVENHGRNLHGQDLLQGLRLE